MSFDPYHRWLGIPASEQPPNHYRLLGIPIREGDPDVIESAADRQMAHVRSFAGGPHSSESQRLLNELAAARLCLLNDKAKAAYDRTLETKSAPATHAVPFVPMAPIPIVAPSVIARPAVRVALPAVIAQPVVSVASPVVPIAPESVAENRWLIELRARAAFYRLLSRAFWTIGALVPCAVALYIYLPQPRVIEREIVVEQPLPIVQQPPTQAPPVTAPVVRPAIVVIPRKAPQPQAPRQEPASIASNGLPTAPEVDDRPFFVVPEPEAPLNETELAARQLNAFIENIAEAIEEPVPEHPSEAWLVHALAVCFRSPIEQHDTFLKIADHLGRTVDPKTSEGRKAIVALKKYVSPSSLRRSLPQGSQRWNCAQQCQTAAKSALMQINARQRRP